MMHPAGSFRMMAKDWRAWVAFLTPGPMVDGRRRVVAAVRRAPGTVVVAVQFVRGLLRLLPNLSAAAANPLFAERCGSTKRAEMAAYDCFGRDGRGVMSRVGRAGAVAAVLGVSLTGCSSAPDWAPLLPWCGAVASASRLRLAA